MGVLYHPEGALFLSTLPNHGGPIKRFLKASGVQTWEELVGLTRPRAAQARDSLMESYKPASVQHAVSAARSLMRFFADRGKVEVNVMADLKTKGTSQVPLWNVLQVGEEEKILAAVRGAHRKRDRAVLLMLIDHGLRASELCKLRWSDLFREPTGRYVMTTVGKSGKPFRMRLSERSVAAALEWSGQAHGAKDLFVFRGDVALASLTRQDVWAIVRRWAKAIGSRVTPHGLRATFISRTLARTGDMEKTRRLARHESAATTGRYARWEVLDDVEE